MFPFLHFPGDDLSSRVVVAQAPHKEGLLMLCRGRFPSLDRRQGIDIRSERISYEPWHATWVWGERCHGVAIWRDPGPCVWREESHGA